MNQTDRLTRRAALGGMAALSLVVTSSPSFASDAPQPFSAPRDRASFEQALRCLTEAVYYEARSESGDGQRAVAQVVLNRVRHPSYPNSVCGVVYQGSQRRTGCQFTFTCDGSMGRYIEAGAWARAESVASAALSGSVYRPVGLALNYHTTAIRPYWAPSLVRQAVVGSHIFYRRPGSARVEAFSQAPAVTEPRVRNRAINAAASGARAQVAANSPARYQSERVQVAAVERPRIERIRIVRPVFERPVSQRTARTQRVAATSAQASAQARVSAAQVRRAPRTTIENGVRVSRGS